jgi:YD repeat-containing protein
MSGSQLRNVQDYDHAKNIFYKREIAPGGKTTETWYELKQDLGRGQFQRQDINGITVAKQSLDTATRTTTTTDARGLNTAISRDQWDNITKIVYPDGSSDVTQYDATYSNITQHTDENGVYTQYTYDAKGNLTKMVEALGLSEQRTTEYSNDADGQRTKETRKGDATTPDATAQYAYVLGEFRQKRVYPYLLLYVLEVCPINAGTAFVGTNKTVGKYVKLLSGHPHEDVCPPYLVI